MYMTTKNKSLYLAVKRNVDFFGLKKELKNILYEKFPIIIQIPTKLPSDLWVDDELNKCCREVKNRQMIFYGIKIPLSHKLYFMVCALLLCGEIEEKDFNDIPFRHNALKNNKSLTSGNLRKSLSFSFAFTKFYCLQTSHLVASPFLFRETYCFVSEFVV